VDLWRKTQGSFWQALAAGSLAIFMITPCGCSSDGDRQKAIRDEGRRVFGATGANPDAGAKAAAGQGWGVMLEHFTGDGHVAQATARRDVLATSIGRADLYVRTTSTGSAVVLGSHADSSDAAAQADLAWARQVVVGNGRPYQRAFLAPPSVGDRGGYPEFNLATVRGARGRDALYTLQVGVWELDDRAAARREAEKDVLRLRQSGQEAFYYHGAQRSMVTIGVFGASDYDAVMGIMSPTVRAVQDTHPNNLLNGKKYRPQGESRWVSSALVSIPD
jgi:hypothetical protein